MRKRQPLSKLFLFGGILAALFACNPSGGARANAQPQIPVGQSPSKGGADALVTIVEFSDFQCPYCKRVNETLKQVTETYGDKVRIVFKNNPLPFHRDAPLAAQAAIAAGRQGKFWELHDLLFENMRALKRENLERYAGELGLDMSRFKADLVSPATLRQVADDQALAKRLGARGTPHLFVNGVRIPGAQSFDRFKTIIDAQLTKAQALLSQGVRRADIYGQLVKTNYEAPKPRQPRRGAADDSKVVYKVPTGSSYWKGGAEPLVTIIEFSEFQCPFCSRVNPTIKQIMSTYGDKVQIVFKHNPLSFHKDAPLAAEAALAAGAQGKFWEMHDLLFANQRALKRDNLNSYAQQLGLDMTKFAAALDNRSFQAQVKADQAVASTFQARGTPHFFVNGRRVRGAKPFSAFKTIIDEEVRKAEALIAKGTARAGLYAAIIARGKTRANAPKPQQRGARPGSPDPAKTYRVPVGNSYGKGPADALVTIVEFSEFQCPFCKRVNPTIAQVMEKFAGKVRVVFKHNPLPFHSDAMPAAEAALEAGAQGKFWEMHDLLFQNQRALKRENLNSYAQQLGLDMTKFAAALDNHTHKAAILADQKVANQFGARGTPNFFINGRHLVGAQPFARFEALIKEELRKAEALVAKGTAPAQVYAAVTKNGLTKVSAAPARKAPAEDNKIYQVPVNAQDASKGPATAPVTIVEFSDFQCPFCGRVLPTLKQIHETYGDKVRVVFKHLPLPFHKDAPLASEATLAAKAQGKFWEMHDLLFQNQRALKRDNLNSYAQQLGLDMTKFAAALDNRTYKAQVEADVALAGKIGARGTPTFFVNGRKVPGALPFARFKTLIDAALAKPAAPTVPTAPAAAPAAPAKPATPAAPVKPAAVQPANPLVKLPNNRLVEQARRALQGKQAGVSIPAGDSYAKGPADALVTIIEFSDFQCPFCKRVTGTLDQIKSTYGDKVRVVFKHNPLPFHKDAPLASRAALAAGAQGKFWEMHDLLFANMRALKRDNILGYAKQLGLDMAAFTAALDGEAGQAAIRADQALARKLGARGTPHFFVNGKRVSGARPFAAFKSIIDAELTAVAALRGAGKSAEESYQARVKTNYEAPKPRQPRRGAADDSKVVYKVPTGSSYWKGGAEPLVTIIEFSEFQCPFCSRVNPTIKQIMSTYGDKVQIVFKHNPLSFHKDAPLAAEAALAAGAQGKFWEMHDLLFANQRALKRDNLNSYAQQLGLDMTKFAAALDNRSFQAQVKADQAVASTFQARGTPHFFVNGRRVRGAKPFSAFKTIIDEEVRKAEALIAKGTARAGLYAAITARGKTRAEAPKPQQRGARPGSPDPAKTYRVPVGNSYGKGPADALVTIVEFSEFQCPFCKRVNPTIAQVMEKFAGKVRVVFKHNPLPFHSDAMPAAEAVLEAGAQGKFWEMHDLLFQNQRALKRENLNSYAQQLGLDMSKFAAALDNHTHKAAILADQKVANQFGARGTPNFFINGRHLVGAQPFARFEALIKEELRKAEALVAKGTAPAQVYAAVTKNGLTKVSAAPARKAPAEDNKIYQVPVNAQDASKGPATAPVTIVEFSDFQCPFCGRVLPTLKQIHETYGDKVRVVFKHLPLPFHKDAPLASEATLAAKAQGKFWEMHDLLFQNQRALKRDNLNSYAQQLGLDMTKFAAALDNRTYKAQVEADVALAGKIGARGTPTFFVNGRKVPGALPFARFKTLIDAALAKPAAPAKAAPAQ